MADNVKRRAAEQWLENWFRKQGAAVTRGDRGGHYIEAVPPPPGPLTSTISLTDLAAAFLIAERADFR